MQPQVAILNCGPIYFTAPCGGNLEKIDILTDSSGFYFCTVDILISQIRVPTRAQEIRPGLNFPVRFIASSYLQQQ